jgi:hypothetical protein
MRQPVVGKRLELGGDRRICQLSMVQKRRESHVKMFLGKDFSSPRSQFYLLSQKKVLSQQTKKVWSAPGSHFCLFSPKVLSVQFQFRYSRPRYTIYQLKLRHSRPRYTIYQAVAEIPLLIVRGSTVSSRSILLLTKTSMY